MASSDDQATTGSAPTTADQKSAGGVSPSTRKEIEPEAGQKADGKEIVAEIQSRAEAVDQAALESVKGAIEEAKRSQPAPEIPPDVGDAGVVHPETEAEEVVKQVTTLKLPIAQEVYEKGLHVKVAGAVRDKLVVGVSSLAALAIWIGRLIKMAHKHTMKVVFRRAD